MTVVLNHAPDYQMSAHPTSPSAQMGINRIMDSNEHPSPSDPRQLPLPTASPDGGNTPAALKTVSDGRIYSLEIHQQPQRARMCGFGDKDRRPITPPPCVRLRIFDALTHQALDISEIDTSYFILTVDLWSADGTREVNLVRHSATSPSISAATATSYPPSHDGGPSYAPNTPMPMGAQFYPGYQPPPAPYGPQPGAPYGMPRQNELSRHMEIAQQASREEAMRIQQEQQSLQSQGHHHTLPSANKPAGQQNPPGHVMHPSTQAFLSGALTATTNGMYQPQQPTPGITYAQTSMLGGAASAGTPSAPTGASTAMNVVDPRSQPGGMFTRNLIGSLAVGAFKLTYPDHDLGIWFILQDLSVRTEGTFRLKLNFVDVGASNPPPPANTADSSGALSTGKLNTSSAPVLATAFSDPFQVFSAKRFPGVKESTELSKAFAKQGIKIPIRKDGAAGGRGNERREWDDGDD